MADLITMMWDGPWSNQLLQEVSACESDISQELYQLSSWSREEEAGQL